MDGVHCFTSASFAYLDRARVLGQTLRQHQPNWKFWLCLSDREPPGFKFDPSQEPIDGLVRVEELGIPDSDCWIFGHDLVELCTAVKGPMLWKLLDEGASKVIYLDPDTAVFSDLSEIEKLLDQHDVILTPHQLEPDHSLGAIVDNEIGSLKHGIYNLGFIAVANSDEGRRFALWWRDRLTHFCFDDIPNGLFVDQRWCDHVPVFFPTTHILRDPGYNAASWNQSRRPITIHEDGSVRAAGSLLRFFHFTKVTWVGQTMLERYCGGRLEIFELLKWYRARLAANAVIGLPTDWWAFRKYSDGRPITREQRIAYRNNPNLRERFKNPFIASSKLRSALKKIARRSQANRLVSKEFTMLNAFMRTLNNLRTKIVSRDSNGKARRENSSPSAFTGTVLFDAPDPAAAVTGVIPLAFEFIGSTGESPRTCTLVLSFPSERLAAFRKDLFVGEGRTKADLRLNSHLLPNGCNNIQAQLISGDGGILWERSFSIRAANMGKLAEAVRASMQAFGTALVVDGGCDASHYDFADPKLKPWFDRPDASEHIRSLKDTGKIDAGEAKWLDQFVTDGFIVADNLLEPDLLDQISAELEDVVARKVQGYEYGSSQRVRHLHLTYPGVRQL